MKVTITKTTALFPSAVFIQWDITEIDDSETGVFYITIERSGSDEGPWETIATALPNAYNFLDDLKLNLPIRPTEYEGANMLSFAREIYYRVSVIPPSGPTNLIYSEPTSVEPRLDKFSRLLKRRILHEERIVLSKLNGIELVVLKKRHWGEYCTECFDLVTKEVTHEDCETCYGTGFVGGYWNPVLIYARIGATPIQTQISPHGMVEVNQTDLTLLDYPHLEEGDLLVDLRRNDRYVVRIVSTTELKRVVVHQVATVSMIARSAVEYKILVDPTTLPTLY